MHAEREVFMRHVRYYWHAFSASDDFVFCCARGSIAIASAHRIPAVRHCCSAFAISVAAAFRLFARRSRRTASSQRRGAWVFFRRATWEAEVSALAVYWCEAWWSSYSRCKWRIAMRHIRSMSSWSCVVWKACIMKNGRSDETWCESKSVQQRGAVRCGEIAKYGGM